MEIREIPCIANKQIIQASCDEDTCQEDMSMPVSKKKEHTKLCVLSFLISDIDLLSGTMLSKDSKHKSKGNFYLLYFVMIIYNVIQ